MKKLKENEEKIDARKVDRKTLQYLRNRAVRLRESGKKNIEVAKILGIAPETVSRWYKRYKIRGNSALKVKQNGRPKGSGKKLTNEQERSIIKKLVDTTPKQLKFKFQETFLLRKNRFTSFALWTREAVRELIKRMYGIDMPLSTVGYYLKRWLI